MMEEPRFRIKRNFKMPTRRYEDLIMGIIAGVFAGLVCVYIFGITYLELMRLGQGIKDGLKTAPNGQIINYIRLISNI